MISETEHNEKEQKYLESKGIKCFFCGSRVINSGMSEPDEPDKLYQNVSCESCGKTWTEVYSLTGVIL